MATTVVNPPQNNQPAQNNGNGFLLGIILLFILAVIFFVYVFPYIQRGFGGAQVNIPSNFDVNVHQTK